MNETFREKTDSIREAFLYLRRFQGNSFVIKIDYPLLESATFPSLMRDLAQLHKLGIKILIVAGARERIEEVLSRYDIQNRMEGLVRISSPEAMPFIKMAAFDVANRIMTMLTANGISAVIGNWVRARTLGVVGGIDYMNTGKVERILTVHLDELIGDGVVPIFPCIGWNASGEPYNVSSNELAGVLAGSVSAEKLFFMAKRQPDWPSRMTVSEVDAFLDQRRREDGSDDILQCARDTCRGGVNRVHILDGSKDGAILQEVFSNLGVGTMVYANEYERIRKIQPDEIPDVLRIMAPWVAAGHLVDRDERTLAAEADTFYVFEVDGVLHGCGGLRPWNGSTAELSGVAVDEKFVELGIGRRITEFLIETAKAMGIEEVFVLTTQAFDWFQQLGFKQGEVSRLPEDRRKTYDVTRKSRAMFLNLS